MSLNANALVTVDELRDWVPMDPGRALSDWERRLEAAINDASDRLQERIRGGMAIKRTTHTAESVRCDGGVLFRLSHAPILSCSAVVDCYGSTIDATTYEVTSSRTALRAINAVWAAGLYAVTWDAGYDPVPVGFRTACCMLAHSIILGRGKDPRVLQERGRDYAIDRSAVDPKTGLPLDVVDCVRAYLYSDLGSVAAPVTTTS